MKTALKLTALVTALLIALTLCACTSPGNDGPANVDVPTPEPTSVPQPTPIPDAVDAFLGDWYGVYSVKDAGGAYAENANIHNDCAMRAALDSFGSGFCYLAVNGLVSQNGGGNVFEYCAAALEGSELVVRGSVGGQSVEWRFRRDGDVRRLAERFENGGDFMDIEILLARPDSLAAVGIRPDALAYISVNGFYGIVDQLGGSTGELPDIVPADDYPDHDFFTNWYDDPDYDLRSDITSVDGRIRLSLPEKYLVLQNDGAGIVLAAPDESVWRVEFTVSETELDSLSCLFSNVPGVDEFYHYTIDGFDFYGAFVSSSVPGETFVFKLFGTDDAGNLIEISISMGLIKRDALAYINSDNASFRQLVLSAKFSVR